MATATTIIAAATAAVSIGKSIHDSSQARKRERSARKRLENYQRQDLSNAYSGMAVPTAGATMAREEAIRTQAETAYLAGQAGVRGLGAVSGIAGMTQESMGRIDAQLQEAQFRLQSMVAEDEARIRAMQEEREQQDIAGLGAEIAYNRSVRDAATSRIVSTGASLAELSVDTDWGNKRLFGKSGSVGAAESATSTTPQAGNAYGQSRIEKVQEPYKPNKE